MRVLLDTHAVIWAASLTHLLSKNAAAAISDPGNEVVVSAVSAWEIATKVRIGKLPGSRALDRDFLQVMEAAGYTLLDVSVPCALRAGRLVGEHKDPFDRLLAAQALIEDMPLVSKDAKLDGFGVRRIW